MKIKIDQENEVLSFEEWENLPDKVFKDEYWEMVYEVLFNSEPVGGYQVTHYIGRNTGIRVHPDVGHALERR